MEKSRVSMLKLSTFYKDKRWEKLIDTLKQERVNGQGDLICEHCGKPIVKAYDCIGHHIIELNEGNVNDLTVSLNQENIMLVHHRCHNIIHERFGYEGTRHIYLVYGSPASGKYEYIKKVAGKDDLILNIDSIYQCISVNDRYMSSKRLSRNVFAIRDLIMDMIATNTGRWKNAYIIGGYPMSSERERIINTLQAEPIYIEATKEECIANASGRGEQYVKYINEWFDRYTE